MVFENCTPFNRDNHNCHLQSWDGTAEDPICDLTIADPLRLNAIPSPDENNHIDKEKVID